MTSGACDRPLQFNPDRSNHPALTRREFPNSFSYAPVSPHWRNEIKIKKPRAGALSKATASSSNTRNESRKSKLLF